MIPLPTPDFGLIEEQLVKIAGKQAASVVGNLAKSKTWALRASHDALGKVPRPRPRRALAAWLKKPSTLQDVLLAPGTPPEDVALDVDAVLSAGNRKWRALPAAERLNRARTVTLNVYDSVLSSHSPGWATRIAHVRERAAHEKTQAQVAIVVQTVDQIAAQFGTAGAGGSDRLELRLRQLPASHHDRIRGAWSEAPEATWSLVQR